MSTVDGAKALHEALKEKESLIELYLEGNEFTVERTNAQMLLHFSRYDTRWNMHVMLRNEANMLRPEAPTFVHSSEAPQEYRVMTVADIPQAQCRAHVIRKTQH